MLRRRTWSALGYLVLGAPLGLLWLAVLGAGLLVGAATAVLGVGVVVLLATLALGRVLGELERHLVNALLTADVPAPAGADTGGEWRVAARQLLTQPRTWRSLVWLLFRGVAGLLVLTGATLCAVTLVALVVLPFVDGYLQWGAGVACSWRRWPSHKHL